MKATGWFLAISLLAGVPPANGAEQSHALRQGADGHLVLALFEAKDQTRRLEPMTIAGQPGMPGVASAEFEHRVQPEPRR